MLVDNMDEKNSHAVSVTFNVRISRWGNFYFFIQNLSAWHEHARKHYNDLWQEELGLFSDAEKESLISFKNIRERYQIEDSIFENAFFFSENPFAVLKQHLHSERYESIKRTFDTLSLKFDLLNIKDTANLERWREGLVDILRRDKVTNPAVSKLLALYKIPIPFKENIDIFLLPSAGQNAGLTEISKTAMGLEISQLSVQRISQTVPVIFHELIYIAFKDKNVFPRTRVLCGYDDRRSTLVCETISRLFFPEGILSLRLFLVQTASQLLPFISRKETRQLLSMADKYVNEGKAIDDIFICQVRDLLQKRMPNW